MLKAYGIGLLATMSFPTLVAELWILLDFLT